MGYIYDGLQPTWSDEDLALFQNGTDPQGHPDTNWQKVAMRKAAPETRHLLTITGGSERVQAYTALSYYDQNSIYRSDAYNYQRYNARTNIDVNIKEIGLRVNTALEAYITNQREPNSSNYNVWSHIQNKKPMEAATNPFGQPYSGTVDNPLVDISEDGGYKKYDKTNVRGTINAVWSVPGVTGLTITGIASYAILNERSKVWSVPAHSYSWEGVLNTVSMPSLSKTANFYDYYNTQLLANYKRSFGLNNVEATVGIEASGSGYDNNSLGRSQYVLDVDQIAAGPVSTATNGAEDGVQWRRASVIARLHYDFDTRYLIELSMRHDGTDNLPKSGRWGTFFSGSLGWNVAEEYFWKDSELYNYVQQFKIRGSYGEIGLDNVSRYAYLTSYGLNATGAYIGNKWYQTFSEGALPSPDLKWYTQHDANIGFDFAALNSRLSGSFDFFYKSTKGYLASPSNVGYTSPLGLSLPQVKSDGESRRKGLNFVGSDFWLVNSRYIRLKNLTIGYDFKYKLLKKVNWLSKCYLSFTGYNLLTFSPAKKWGLDPEIPSANGYSYPVSRVYTMSLNIGF